MLSPRWHKMLSDLWLNRTRSVLVVLSLAIGVFAVGTVATVKPVLLRDLDYSYTRTNPQSATVYTEKADDQIVEQIRRLPGVKAADGRRMITARLRLPSGEAKDFVLTMLSDFEAPSVNRMFQEAGAWPPGPGEVLVERSSLPAVEAAVGETVAVEMPGGVKKSLKVGGAVHDIHRPLAAFSLRVFGAVSAETFEQLGQPRTYNTIHFTITGDPLDEARIRQVAGEIKDLLLNNGLEVTGTKFPTPGKSPADGVVGPLILILQAISLFVLLLSGLLVTNTISALLTEQIRQIGMMKAIGATRRQLTGIYLSAVAIFGLVALLLAAPLSAVTAGWLVGFLSGLLNITSGGWYIPASALILQGLLALGLPLLAALFPILRGTAVSVREAVNDYGVQDGTAGEPSSWERLVAFLPATLLLSVHNTFRRKGRLVRTVLVLVVAGAVFTGVLSVRQSLLTTLDVSLKSSAFDVQVEFEQPQRLDDLRAQARQLPGVAAADGWLTRWVTRIRPDGGVSKDFILVALDPASPVVQPVLVEGRWLKPEDRNAVVINVADLGEEPDVKVGSTITLKLGTKETPFEVVGIARNAYDDFYVPYAYYAGVMNQTGLASHLMVRAQDRNVDAHTTLGEGVVKQFESQGARVAKWTVMESVRTRVINQFTMLVAFLVIMGVLLALVGGLGLAGTMGINVLERTREVGVLRAIGASTRSVLQVIITEGLFIGLISWVLAAIVAWPTGLLLLKVIQVADMKSQPSFTYSATGLLLWLVLAEVVAGLASFLPAWRAARLSVREVLAYE
jgi:putative ABC transport system permease protein